MKEEIIYKERLTSLFLNLLELANYDVEFSDKYEKEYQKRLKFQKLTDWKKFRASVDLLDDTEYALISFFTYQLGDKSNTDNNVGEIQLRLYGILNAVYLQIGAYKQLCNLMNYPKAKEAIRDLEQLDIYKLRNIAGSHTVDYMYDKDTIKNNPNVTKTTSFRIVQCHLEKTGSKVVALDENNLSYEFNVLECLTIYEKFATELLIDLLNHSIKKLVFDRNDRIEMLERLSYLTSNLIDYATLDKNKNYSPLSSFDKI
ncbi:hypothetical protein ACE193_12955 [Bernardetia sp. OM2101]|uniref:hypothetical protein n=1 Tax=Bernardetia sp. OM2101 TaxID=3344876 RepID=UPI0035CE9946